MSALLHPSFLSLSALPIPLPLLPILPPLPPSLYFNSIYPLHPSSPSPVTLSLTFPSPPSIIHLFLLTLLLSSLSLLLCISFISIIFLSHTPFIPLLPVLHAPLHYAPPPLPPHPFLLCTLLILSINFTPVSIPKAFLPLLISYCSNSIYSLLHLFPFFFTSLLPPFQLYSFFYLPSLHLPPPSLRQLSSFPPSFISPSLSSSPSQLYFLFPSLLSSPLHPYLSPLLPLSLTV